MFHEAGVPDIVHKDDPVSFVEYAYTVKITQPNVLGTRQEPMKLPDAELWRAQNEMDSLEDLRVYKLVPRSTVPPRSRVYKSRWVFKVEANNTHKACGGWRLGPSPRKRLRQHLRSCLPTLESSNGANDRRRDGLGGGTARRENCFLLRGY